MGCHRLTYNSYNNTEIPTGKYSYLGNVLNVITDRKLPVADANDNTKIAYFTADVVNFADYLPYGQLAPNRHGSEGSYRFGFNGKEKLDEVSGDGNTYDYGFRIYNPRIGRFLSVDPLTKSYPWYTPYQFAGNKPIWAIDLDGLEEYYTSSGELIGKYGTSTEIRIVHKDFVEAAINITANQNQPSSDVMNDKLYNTGTHGVFNTNDEAATDWAKNVNPKSIEDNLEYGSTLYELEIKGEKYITYAEPAKGSPAGVYTDRDAPAPEGTKRTGIIHSHGAYDPRYKNNEFSGTDRSNADRREADSYVATPNGSLQRYDVCNKKDLIMKTDIPSDPKDPKRLNEVAPEIPLPVVINQK